MDFFLKPKPDTDYLSNKEIFVNCPVSQDFSSPGYRMNDETIPENR